MEVPSVNPALLEEMLAKAEQLERDTVEYVATRLGPSSSAQEVLDALDKYEPMGFVGYVFHDEGRFILLWDRKPPDEPESA